VNSIIKTGDEAYLDWLFCSWADWVRDFSFGGGCAQVKQDAPSRGALLDDDLAMRVDGTLARMDLANRRILKRVYLRGEIVDERYLKQAFREFEYVFESESVA
jgi:hypothetical protein